MKKKQTQHCRIRIRFEKNESLRFLGHRDLIRALERIFRRTGLELVMSEGFHPRPRMRFSDPLAVGQIGLNEVMDLTVGAINDPVQLQEALNRHSIPGLIFKQIDILDDSVKKLKAKSFCYEVSVQSVPQEQVQVKLERFLASKSLFVQRKGRDQQIDIRPLVLDLRLEGCQLQMRLMASQETGVRPTEILELLDLSADSYRGAVMTRTTVQL
ncbi:MAG: TIGR03936 family radical SAM-associated protein [Pirellulales bacterium]|nr:TIGR03936 family radical SAM-associated protein [Pirellulales bacterium]